MSSATSNQAAYNGITPPQPAHMYTYQQPQGAVSGQQGMQDARFAQYFANAPFTQFSDSSGRQDNVHQQVNAVYAAFNQGNATNNTNGTGGSTAG